MINSEDDMTERPLIVVLSHVLLCWLRNRWGPDDISELYSLEETLDDSKCAALANALRGGL